MGLIRVKSMLRVPAFLCSPRALLYAIAKIHPEASARTVTPVPVDPFEKYPGYCLRRASAATMARLARRFAVLGLRPSEASVLMVIDANPNITQSEIGRMLDIARANMAPLMARLSARELVRRQRVDGRSHGLVLSSTGRSVTDKVKKAVAAHEKAVLSKIPPALREGMLAALRALWADD